MGRGKEKEEEKKDRDSSYGGQTPLDLALRAGHNNIIQLLVQEGGKCCQVCGGRNER